MKNKVKLLMDYWVQRIHCRSQSAKPNRVVSELMSQLYSIRISFSLSAGNFLWANNQATVDRFHFPIMPVVLPITPELTGEIEMMAHQYDQSLDWSDPGGDSLWDEETDEAFYVRVVETVERLKAELGTAWSVSFPHGLPKPGARNPTTCDD